jgi:thiol-disulfide isomerase/thioredoxin
MARKFSTLKKAFAIVLGAAALLLSGQRGIANGTNAVITDMNALVAKVNAKIQKGATAEKDYADELKAFDALYAKYKDQKTDEVAQILMMKAELYLAVVNAPEGDPEKAAEVLQKVKRDLPETEFGKRVDSILDGLKRPIEAERIRDTLVVGAKFPDFNVTDLAGQPLSVANNKGRVVLIDFWATWCPPCRAELPNVIATYQKYHSKGFDIIGVSLDEDKAQLLSFIKDHNMAWPQYYDGKKWDNQLAMNYGVEIAPTTYLLDGEGKIIGKDLRGDDLKKAVAAALSKN